LEKTSFGFLVEFHFPTPDRSFEYYIIPQPRYG